MGVLLAQRRHLLRELLPCQCLYIDDLQLLCLVFDAPVLIHAGQLSLELPDTLFQTLAVALQVGVMLFVVLNRSVKFCLALL